MTTSSSKGNSKAMGLLTSLFFMWGFITVMNDVLINTFRSIFELSGFQAGLVQFSFFGAFFFISLIYFLVSGSTGKDPLNRIGYRQGMSYSLVICGLGCIAFYPAAVFESYAIFLFALFILASGVTCLQICANPYAAILGPSETASSRLNFVQGLNSMGTTLGPLLGTILIFQVFSPDGNASAESVGKTYLLYGSIFMALAVVVGLSKLPSFTNSDKIESGFGVLKFRHLVLGIVAIFFYVGGEVTVGSYLADLFMNESVMGLPQDEANYYLSYYWGGAMIGRLMGAISLSNMKNRMSKLGLMAITSLLCFGFIFIAKFLASSTDHTIQEDFNKVMIFGLFLVANYLLFLLGRFKAARTLMVFSLCVIILLLVVVFGQGELVFWSAIAIGLFNSIMWSNLFTLAIRDLGKYTSQGSSLLVMAIVGGAFFPLMHGALIDSVGIQTSYLLPIVCYLYLAFYGLKGYRIIPTTK